MHNQAQANFCRDAVEIQDACNPVAIVNALARHLGGHENREALGIEGWEDVLRHPAFILFIDKLQDMIGRPGLSDYSKALDHCEEIVSEDMRQGIRAIQERNS